jgi:hypothetical protein
MQRVVDLARDVAILSVGYIKEYIKNKSKNYKKNNNKSNKIKHETKSSN